MPRRCKASEGSGGRFRRQRELQVALDDFGAHALREEAARQGVPLEQLAAYALSYYLADLDSGRLTRRLPPLPGIS